MKLNVLVILSPPLFSPGREMLETIKKAVPDVSLEVCGREELTLDAFKEAEVIYGWPSKEHISHAERLRWLHVPSAGVDGYSDKSIYRRKDIILTNSKGVYGVPISEHVIGLILAFNRNLHLHIRSQMNSQWTRYSPAREFYGSTVGIIGLGGIGREVAVRSRAMGARVIAVKRNPEKVPEYVDGLFGEEGIDNLLKQSDYVVISLPDTPKTRGILSKDRIAGMKKSAFVINVGRGAAIDQDALIKALEEGRLAGAGLDVTTPEPLPEDSPLWNMPNVIITSHTSGYSPENMERSLGIFMGNLKAFINGETLQNGVDFEAGY